MRKQAEDQKEMGRSKTVRVSQRPHQRKALREEGVCSSSGRMQKRGTRWVGWWPAELCQGQDTRETRGWGRTPTRALSAGSPLPHAVFPLIPSPELE